MSDRRKDWLEQRLAGWTYRRIGEHAGVSHQRVQQVLAPPSAIRRQVVAEANGKCEHCGLEVASSGHVHHMDDALRSDIWFDAPESLQLLCLSCHSKAHGGPSTKPELEQSHKEPPAQARIDTIPLPDSTRLSCAKCGHAWVRRLETLPVQCPRCKSRTWREEEGEA